MDCRVHYTNCKILDKWIERIENSQTKGRNTSENNIGEQTSDE